MTRKELEYIAKILLRIKNPDEYIAKAIAYINKDIAIFDSRRGQLKDQYEADWRGF